MQNMDGSSIKYQQQEIFNRYFIRKYRNSAIQKEICTEQNRTDTLLKAFDVLEK